MHRPARTLTEVVDDSGAGLQLTTVTEYDELGRVIKITDPNAYRGTPDHAIRASEPEVIVVPGEDFVGGRRRRLQMRIVARACTFSGVRGCISPLTS